ncbi:MAG: FAD-dependent oxidoreductase [Lentisphaerae bacterium]|nr:FAD-dependent oxidoreductase [Lentisphaerota bacterium]
MKISVPVIANVDYLLLGGTLGGCRKAIELAEKGYSVFVATSYSHFGEDVCSTLELLSDGKMTPMQLKHELDLRFIRAGIDFLFQSPAVALTLDAAGRIAGAVIANRTGFQAVNARCILDATQWGLASRLYNGTDMFEPGEYDVSLIQIGACNTAGDMKVEKLPFPVAEKDKTYPVFRAVKRFSFAEFSPRSMNDALVKMRRACFHPDMARCANQCVFHVGKVYEPADPASGILAPENYALAEKVLSARPASAAVKTRENPGPAKDFDAVRLDKPVRFDDPKLATIEFDLNSLPVLDSCDVLIVGAGTAGAPAAIAAARSGAETIVTENLFFPGGICTSGLVCSYCHGNRCGFTRELDEGRAAMGTKPDFVVVDAATYNYNPIWKQQWLLEQMDNAGVRQLYHTLCIGAAVRGNQVCGSLCAGPFGAGVILAERCIDATGNADLAAAAGGVTKPLISNGEPAVQGAGLAPAPIAPHNENSDYSFVCDSDVVDGSRFFVMARGKFQQYFDVTDILDTRERRRIDGDLSLQPQDFYANKMYSDTITIAMSNFDTHGFIVHPLFLLQATEMKRNYYAKVPFRALLPKNLEHILVTGLAVSAHRDCMPLIRMQPDLQNQGYAAGLAAAMAAEDGLPMRKIDIRELQKKLVGKGILPESILGETDAVGGIDKDSSHYFLASVFLDEQAALPRLKEQFAADPENVRLAHILAFLGDSSGKELLRKTVDAMDWDLGWNYRGMGQFGPSCSPLDSMIFALDRIGAASECVLKKLKSVTDQTDFSHVRAVCMSLINHPQKAAAADLRRLLALPGMSGHAVKSYADALASNREARNDTSVRNCQLKEIYLAKALSKCDPEDELGAELLASYRDSMQGYYSLFAKN